MTKINRILPRLRKRDVKNLGYPKRKQVPSSEVLSIPILPIR
jgi:hypothetical protein